MTPGKFEYHRARSVDEAVALLGQYGDEGKILAGGHSLLPMMKLRMAVPSHLIDINAIADLKGIREDGDAIVIGAAVTQAEALGSELIRQACPLITEATALIADPQVRNCGTMGGNVANGDPGNDHPAVMMALGATYVLRGTNGERSVDAAGFYEGTYATALAEDELLTAIRIPKPAAGHGWSYQKMKRKVGDYATAAAATVVTVRDGVCRQATIALTNVAPASFLATEAAAGLVGGAVDDAAIGKAADAVKEAADPVSDLRGPAEFRRHMAAEMTRRALRAAAARATEG